MVALPSVPIYQQFEHIDPPRRFLETVEGYLDYLRQTDTTWSLRRLAKEARVSHGYFTTLRDGSKPTANSIEGVVGVINAHVPGNQVWNIEAAYRAAGQEYVDDTRSPKPRKSARPGVLLDGHNDLLPNTVSKIPAPILRLAEIERNGLGGAVSMRETVTFSNNMAVIADRVPGFDEQHEGEWVLVQRPGPKADQISWVIVREGEQIRAVRLQAVNSQQRVIAWILGVMRLAA